MRIANRRFVPSAIGTVLVIAAVALFVRLGMWQLERADEKKELIRRYETASALTSELNVATADQLTRYQKIYARGRFDPAHQILLDNMPSPQARPGFHVLTALELEEGGWILVDRGWVPLGPTRSTLPDVSVSSDVRDVVGRLDALPRAGIALRGDRSGGADGWPRIMNYPQQDEIEAVLGHELIPGRLLLDPDQPDGYQRDWHGPVNFGPERHVGYAVQWFALALAALAIYVIVNLHREPS